MLAVRWTHEHDHYVGPFTFARERRATGSYALALRSRGDEDRKAYLRLTVWKWTLCVRVPGWCLRPYVERRQAQSWGAETIKRLGRDWYEVVEPREFGVSVSEGYLSVQYGRQSMDSLTEKSWGCFLPWTQWRHVRHSYYGVDGAHYFTEPRPRPGRRSIEEWKKQRDHIDACPTVSFEFEDYDGERLVATTRIEEMEWLFGEGWFKWLSWFRRPKIRRSLDLHFSGEVGMSKGSWKGGTIGHSIDMIAGEDHEAAFRRYCMQEHSSRDGDYRLKFIGRAA